MATDLPDTMLAALLDLGPRRRNDPRRPRKPAEPSPRRSSNRGCRVGRQPTDWKARLTGDGDRPAWVIPNQDGAGVIVAVGDAMTAERIRERVWLWQAQWQRASGTAAEYVALPSAHAAPLPDGASLDLGAGLGIPAMTAHGCLSPTGRSAPTDHVLVQGGAGAVGHAAIELPRRAGARVAATVSGPEKGALAAAAGAELVVNYHHEDVARRIRDWAPGGVEKRRRPRGCRP
jgi:NADPH2:quinone reductase